MTHKEFADIRARAESTHALPLYKDMEYQMGIWWDFKSWYHHQHWDSRTLDKMTLTPQRLEQVLYNAFTVADRYVWVYSYGGYRRSPWWHFKYGNDANWAVDMPQEYIDAFRNCRKPHDLAWTPGGKEVRVIFDDAILVVGDKITKSTPNLFKNPGFELWPDGEKAPNGWDFVTTGVNWGESATLWREESRIRAGRYAARLGMARLGDVGHISLDQNVPAAMLAGKAVTFGAWIKSNDPDTGNLEIVDVYDGAKSNVSQPNADGWRFHTLTAPVPDNITGYIAFRLRAFIQYAAH